MTDLVRPKCIICGQRELQKHVPIELSVKYICDICTIKNKEALNDD